MRPFALAPGEGTSVENPTGGVTTFKVVGDQSGGGLTVIEGVSAPGEGPPLHLHREQDEFIYTLDGTFRVRLGDDLIEARPGSFVFIPRNTPHTWQNVGDGRARFVATLIPASAEFEEFFMRYAVHALLWCSATRDRTQPCSQVASQAHARRTEGGAAC